MRLRLTVAYDGRPFRGYATQVEGLTIQDALENALGEILKTPLRVHHAGRTDAGVHALGQIIHFDAPSESSMNPLNYLAALNTKLPSSIRILDCEEVAPDFHARFSATSKHYQYRLDLNPILSPFQAGLVWHLPRQLDPDTLAEALSYFIGEHDFRHLSARRGNETDETNYRRHITRAELTCDGPNHILDFEGNGFLYKMVRLLTGTAVQAAQGRLRLDQVASFLDATTPPDRPAHCAPPDGLTLVEVKYT